MDQTTKFEQLFHSPVEAQNTWPKSCIPFVCSKQSSALATADSMVVIIEYGRSNLAELLLHSSIVSSLALSSVDAFSHSPIANSQPVCEIIRDVS